MKFIMPLLIITIVFTMLGCGEKINSYTIDYNNQSGYDLWVSSLNWGKQNLACGSLGNKSPGKASILILPIPKQTTIKWEIGNERFSKTIKIPSVSNNFDGIILFTFTAKDDVKVMIQSKSKYAKDD